MSVTASKVTPRGSALMMSPGDCPESRSSIRMWSGVKKGSMTARNLVCSGGVKAVGRQPVSRSRRRDVTGSAAAATTSACLKSVTTARRLGHRIHGSHAIVGTALIGEGRLRQRLPRGNTEDIQQRDGPLRSLVLGFPILTRIVRSSGEQLQSRDTPSDCHESREAGWGRPCFRLA
jgi:hypothetical protein